MKKSSLLSLLLGLAVIGVFVFAFPVEYYGQEARSSGEESKWQDLKKGDQPLIDKFQFRRLGERYAEKVESFQTKKYQLAARTRSDALEKVGKFFNKFRSWVKKGDKRLKRVEYQGMKLQVKDFDTTTLNMKMDTGSLEFEWEDVLDQKPDFFAAALDQEKLKKDEKLALGMLVLETTGDASGREILGNVVNRYREKEEFVKKYLAMRKEKLPKEVDLTKALDVKDTQNNSSGQNDNNVDKGGSSGYFHKERAKKVAPTLLKAANYLAVNQNEDGSHGKDSPRGGSVGMKVAITSLVGKFLTAATMVRLSTGPKSLTQNDFDSMQMTNPEIYSSLKQTNLYLFPADPSKREDRPDKLRDVWETLYRIEYIAFLWQMPMFKNNEEAQKGLKREFDRAVDMLYKRQIVPGGWGYYQRIKQGMTFASSAVIMALTHALRNGVPVSGDRLDKVNEMKSKALEKIQTDFKVKKAQYMYRPGSGGENDRSRAIRGPLVELSQIKAKAPTGDLELAVDNFFKHRKWVEKVKGKNGTHIGTGNMAPYYYLYHHYYTVRAIRHLQNKDKKMKYLDKIIEILLDDAEKVNEKQVKYTDAPILGEHVVDIYGTAFGGLSLFYYARTLPDVSDQGSGEGSGGGEPTTDD